MKNKTSLIIAIIVLLLSVPPVYSILSSPPSAGYNIAAENNIPHRAVMAHRGLSYWAPESTEPAYILARDVGADYLEADIQRTADGVLVAFHDETLERVSNVADVFPEREADPFGSFTYNELQQLDVGTWFNETKPERAREAWEGQKIITLERLIDIAEAGENKPGLYLETKSAELYPGIEQQLVDVLQRRNWIGGRPAGAEAGSGSVKIQAESAPVIFQSFVFESVEILKEIAADVPRVYLVDGEKVDELGWDHFIEKAIEAEAGLGPSGYFAWPWYTGPAHRQGILLHHYTINQAWQMRLLMFFGSDGLFTDRSELMLDVLGRDRPELEELYEQYGY